MKASQVSKIKSNVINAGEVAKIRHEYGCKAPGVAKESVDLRGIVEIELEAEGQSCEVEVQTQVCEIDLADVSDNSVPPSPLPAAA